MPAFQQKQKEQLVDVALDFINELHAGDYQELFFHPRDDSIRTLQHAFVCYMSEFVEQMREEVEGYENLTVVDNPFAEEALSIMRDKDTPNHEFRANLAVLTDKLMSTVARIAGDLVLVRKNITTPLATTEGVSIDSNKIVLVPLFRAGEGMLHEALKKFPEARVSFLDFERDEETLIARASMNKVNEINDDDVVVLLDPMLATGGSAENAVDMIKAVSNPAMIISANAVSAPEGIRALAKAHPDVEQATVAVDERLNDIGFIHPGLGDAGDRQFGEYQPNHK